ncbi:MAG: ABC transporter permease [Bacillota bacterium]|nr:ABC transporter permease [Bacillota bacterium]NLJ02518.1 ABC transporter permease [Bacillota bacterium]
MSLIPVLVKREFTSRVKGPAYIITTILGVVVFIALSFLPPLMERISQSLLPAEIELVVFEQPGEPSILPYLQQAGDEREGFSVYADPDLSESDAYRMVLEQGLSGLLLVDGPLYTLVTPDASNIMVNDEVENILNLAVSRRNAVRLGLSDEDMASLFRPVDLRVREISPLGEDGEELDSAAHTQSMVLAYFLLFMIYMALIMYGNMVASGVAEEKSSRIMEVMVSTVRPVELMLGKIIGVGSLGLLQYFIWIGTGLVMNSMGRAGAIAALLGSSGQLSSIPLDIVMWFGLYFILGYFFYASIFAAAGALVSRVEEVSQVVSIIMMLIIVGFFAAYISFLNPNSTLAVVTSLVPFTAPMVMFARIVLGSPGLIEVIASVLIMLVSVFLGAWFSGKIYSIGILLYGKRPTLRQVIRLVRN